MSAILDVLITIYLVEALFVFVKIGWFLWCDIGYSGPRRKKQSTFTELAARTLFGESYATFSSLATAIAFLMVAPLVALAWPLVLIVLPKTRHEFFSWQSRAEIEASLSKDEAKA